MCGRLFYTIRYMTLRLHTFFCVVDTVHTSATYITKLPKQHTWTPVRHTQKDPHIPILLSRQTICLTKIRGTHQPRGGHIGCLQCHGELAESVYGGDIQSIRPTIALSLSLSLCVCVSVSLPLPLPLFLLPSLQHLQHAHTCTSMKACTVCMHVHLLLGDSDPGQNVGAVKRDCVREQYSAVPSSDDLFF